MRYEDMSTGNAGKKCFIRVALGFHSPALKIRNS